MNKLLLVIVTAVLLVGVLFVLQSTINPRMISPIIQSGSNTWAPAGLVYKECLFYFAGLRSQSFYSFNPISQEFKDYFKNRFGRLREVVIDPKGNLYITTSNKDGRTMPRSGDDKIIKIE